jgi:hypothetical protein
MGAFKSFSSSDITITPFEVNKEFNFQGKSELIDSNVGIDRYLGKNSQGLFNPNSSQTTGEFSPEYEKLIYKTIKNLYYSNNIDSPLFDTPLTASVVNGVSSEDDRLIGGISSQGRYNNYFPTTLNFEKKFPSSPNSIIGVMSIPSKLFGEYIMPQSFTWQAESGSIHDDGEGNIIDNSTDQIVGNIFYSHGLITLIDSSSSFTQNLVESPNVNCSFSSTITIYESQYSCTINENEFNFTQNPSIIKEEDTIKNFATGSDFQPYITCVGLYNNNNELLAVGKLSNAIPTISTTDMTILINIDR